ncbi:hypothetical protein SLEP1_g49965 [Rubroshorea leprosula]|uniref:non-specific serine/threonine protein kinase n=1 Tax=Rubroshorea leprosula TaxID=152421 RepID=A0AAV5M1U4_9ROSI|nr:hypothetical protein SLEP1_g49965 [Rubroshorea leprosula]
MAIASISPSEPLPDGKTLISNDGSFELGFFSPGSSGNRYLGIWYKDIPGCTVVWVANRVNPINDSSGMLMVTTTGDLQLLSQNTTVVWSANSTKAAQNPKLRLLGSGNLVLIDGSDDSEAYLWQSFDYPSDTLLPEMKLGWDLRTGLNRRLSAWKNADDPSPGDLTWEIERQGNPEAVLLKGSEIHFRFGPWNGLRFSGSPSLGPDNQVFGDEFVSNEEEVYYLFFLKNKSQLLRVVLNQTDNTRRRYIWDEETRTWKLFTLLPNDYCDQYGLCGAYGNCDSTQSPACQCFPGFKPKSPDGWSSGDWSQGCVRNKPLNCQGGDVFKKFRGLKLPNATHSLVNKTLSLKECKDKCTQNCSCMAYTSANISGRASGCAIWFGDLVDMRQFQSDEQDLFIRMSASESACTTRHNSSLVFSLAFRHAQIMEAQHLSCEDSFNFRHTMDVFTLIAFVSTCFLVFLKASTAIDSISPSEPLPNGKTLVSDNGNFELGFFHPGSSGNRYLGIWYKNIPVRTVVWVANRVNPINDSSGMLMVTTTGHLQLLSQNITVVWSANSKKAAQNPILQLLNSGNLVLIDGRDGNSGAYLWQSFDYPSDTLLPGMKLGWDLRTSLDRRLSAWKNSDDPSPGDFTSEIELQGNPEAVLWKGSKKYYRNGPWNGIRFSGAPIVSPENQVFSNEFVSNEEEVYYMFSLKNKPMLSRTVLNQTDYTRQRYTWNEETRTWKLYAYLPNDNCDKYGLCGAYGNCDSTQPPPCQCLKGFKPKSPDGWSSGEWSQGCVRNKPLNCQASDGFIQFESLDIRGRGSGCAIWFGDLVDIRQFQSAGQDLFIRMSASELGYGKKQVVIIVISVMLTGMVFIGLLCYIWIKKRRKQGEGENEEMELPIFDLTTMVKATDNFSGNNMLGQGGFGPVYKGILADGQEIAVKRLSKSSGQGMVEFKNEVILIAKLQHRNLVKLLGCCIQGDEKMLIYEYMPNKSLDYFIFDQTKKALIDWQRRMHIIGGIARGLLYLHQDSRLRIIHRDLKTSNVLLDKDMNPKISDFGLARMFLGDQTEARTNRVVGTYGYMSPEYAVDGHFSIKSDVFSFGVIVLEIISGKKNRGFHHSDHYHNLLGHVWRLWIEERALEVMDTMLGDSCTVFKVLRCIHVALLCVQKRPEDRPDMSSVVLMLCGENPLPQPKLPGFYTERNLPEEEEVSSSPFGCVSVNESFDHPTDTLLPAMNLGWYLRTDLHKQPSAWKSPDDPSLGDFTLGLGLNNYPELTMLNIKKSMILEWSQILWEICDHHGHCGVHETRDNTELPLCQCLTGFKPISPQNWNSVDCSKDTTYSWVNKSLDLKERRSKCFQNCSCMALTQLDIREKGSGCAIWFGDLIDFKQFHDGGQDLCILMSGSESDSQMEPISSPHPYQLVMAGPEFLKMEVLNWVSSILESLRAIIWEFGNLFVTSQNKTILWSSNSNREAQNLVIQLLDSGNLVLSDEKDGNSEIFLWQSFDYPTDMLLPGMKLGWDLRTGLH